MKPIKLKCSYCKAKVVIDVDELQRYCPHCKKKLLFDLDQMERMFIEKEQTKRSLEKTKRAEEITKRVQVKYEYKDKKDRRDRREGVIYGIVMVSSILFSILLLGFIFYMDFNERREHQINNEVQVLVSSKDLKEESVENAKLILKNCGFKYVNTSNKEDLVFGFFQRKATLTQLL